MSIVRVKKRDHPFVQIDKRCLEDSRLSWKTKGILAYLLSRPDDWVVRFEQLQTVSKDGKSSIRSAFKELSELGYCERVPKQVIDEDGRSVLMGSEYVVYELPDAGRSETSDVKDPRGSENLTVRESHTTNKDSITNNEIDINKNTNNAESSSFDEGESKRQMEPNVNTLSTKPEVERSCQEILDNWNELYGCKLRLTKKRIGHIRARISEFGVEDLKKSMENRLANRYWDTPAGRPHRNNIDSFIRNIDQVDKYLNQESTQEYTRKEEMPF